MFSEAHQPCSKASLKIQVALSESEQVLEGELCTALKNYWEVLNISVPKRPQSIEGNPMLKVSLEVYAGRVLRTTRLQGAKNISEGLYTVASGPVPAWV